MSETPAVAALPGQLRDLLFSIRAETDKIIAPLAGAGVEAYWQPLAEPRSSYYTGVFFETYVPGFTEPLVRGGIYNDLVKRYANIEAGACGFALDLLSF